MDLVIVYLTALVRPAFFIDIGGSNLFDVAAIGMFAVLIALFFYKAAWRNIDFTPIDVMIFAFGVWCTCVYLIYFEKTELRFVAQLLIPLFTYTIVRMVIRDQPQYLRLVSMILIGFVVPLVFSMGLIVTGKGVDFVNYWSGVTRWQGAYSGSHSFGHNMAFLLMATLVYLVIRESTGTKLRGREVLFVSSIAAMGVVGLALSQVRTAILGAAILLIGFGWWYRRKLLWVVGAMSVVAAIVLWSTIMPMLFPDVYYIQKESGDAFAIASGRPEIWSSGIDIFLDLPIDEKLAGAGIGSKLDLALGVQDAHNDWLTLVLQTGVIGAAIFLSIQVLFLRAILRIEGRERYIFVAIFCAVQLMNFVSNSYITRFGLAQMFYMLLTYVDLRPRSALDSSAQSQELKGYPKAS